MDLMPDSSFLLVWTLGICGDGVSGWVPGSWLQPQAEAIMGIWGVSQRMGEVWSVSYKGGGPG